MSYTLYCACLFLGFYQFSLASNPEDLQKKADTYYQQRKFDSAVYYYQKALQLHENDDYEQIIKTRNEISKVFLSTRQFDKAKPFLDETQQLAENHLDTSNPELIDLYNQLGRYTWFHGHFAKGLEYLVKAKNIYNKTPTDNPEQLMTIYANFGFAHGYSGAIDSSLYYFQESVALAKQLGNPLKVADRYSDLSFAYMQKGDYESALEILQQSLAINKKHLPANHYSLGKNYNNLTYITIELWDHDLAIRYANEALKIIEQNEGLDSYSAAIAYMNLAAANANKNNWESALFNSEKAEEAFIKAAGPGTPYLGNVYLIKGKAYQFLKKPDLELKYLTQSLDFKLEVFGNYHSEVVIACRELGDYYLRNEQSEKAFDYLQKSLAIADSLKLENYLTNESLITLAKVYELQEKSKDALATIQQALNVLVPGFNKTEISANPVISDAQAKMNLLMTLKIKTALLADLYKNTPDATTLDAALACVNTTNQLIDTIRISYKTKESKQLLVENAIPFYENAINITFQAYEATREKKYLNLTFQLFEKNKSLLLLEGIRETQARKFAGLPESLLKKERQLKFDLNYYQEQLYQAKNNSDSDKISEINQLLTANQLAYQELIETLENQYPAYHQYKYQWQSSGLEEIQKNILDGSTGLIEYFVGTNNIYVFCASATQAHMFKVPKTENYTNLINQSRKQLLDYQTISQDINKAMADFQQSAYALYQLLLQEPLTALGDEVKNLIIVPDGQLGYLPFEALMTDAKVANSYLLKNYSFSYTYSSTLLNQLQNGLPASKTMRQYAGFAPNYDEGLLAMLDIDDGQLLRDGNYQLPGAVSEVERISGIMQGKAWLSNDATESNFKENANQYGILHLAMHGLLNDKEPMFSKLVFSQNDTLEDGFLNAAEIYNLKLNAQLAVLSACNTASGKINRGEGIMSLSRAFMYAGCPSIVASLWKAPDAATSKIMVHFYKNLKQGMNKSEAIRQAKLQYMEDNPGITSHPFFWSTFVAIGDMQPIKRDSFWQSVGWQVLLVIIIALGFFVLIRKTMKR